MRTVFALRARVGVPWVVFWNATLISAMAVDGFSGRPESPLSIWLTAGTMFATTLLWAAIWQRDSVRAWAFAPARVSWVREHEIRLWAIVPLVLGIAVLNELYAWWS